MFFMIDNIDITSYADDKTPYSVGKKASVKLLKWFHGNDLKAT